jgi:NAD(P)-dependent dehydrogenase (short-subunit alcohol dehydrogenase family)
VAFVQSQQSQIAGLFFCPHRGPLGIYKSLILDWRVSIRVLACGAGHNPTNNLETTKMVNVLITGTSTGIGFATALDLGRAGHTVYATMRNPGRSPQLGETVAREKLPIKIMVMDVDSDSSVAGTVKAIHAEGGQVDVLVNNAGAGAFGAVEELPLDTFRAIMETNYFGALRCIQAVLPEMRERKSGCIINVSSVSGRAANSPLAAYTASKHALEAMSEALAQEAKPFNIRVAIVEPGIIDTPMSRRAEVPLDGTKYRQVRRYAKLFRAAFESEAPRPPSLVAEAIRGIIESGTWKLRHPVGPGSVPAIEIRKTMSDEEWVERGALDDDAWYERIEREFGLDVRPKG